MINLLGNPPQSLSVQGGIDGILFHFKRMRMFKDYPGEHCRQNGDTSVVDSGKFHVCCSSYGILFFSSGWQSLVKAMTFYATGIKPKA